MTYWFIGCTHFGHANIIKLAGRPFENVRDMDEALIDNWNRHVKPWDIVYHVGDFCWGNPKDYLPRLNGTIKMVWGNHDSPHNPIWAGYESYEHVAIKIEDTTFVLFHYPIEDWDRRYRGSIHLHAHTHQKEFCRPNLPWVEDSALDKGDKDLILPPRFPEDMVCNRFNVGVDATNFRPISYEEIVGTAYGHPANL